jgi:hypothetical protein
MDKRYTPVELSGMTFKRLQDVAVEVGIKKPFHKNLNATARRERILRQYAKLDAAAVAPSVSAGQAPVNPAFEAKCDTATPPPVDGLPISAPSPQPERRGGARVGAGRPLGMTAERARLTHVTGTPHRIYKAGFRLLFDLWADRVGTDQVCLTEEEAIDLALPWSQIGEYLGWNDYVPEWADIILCGIWTTYNTFKIKARVARQWRAEHPKVVKSVVVADGSIGTTTGH